jgi:hypothetical protein
MIWRQVCWRYIYVSAIVVLDDDLRDSGSYMICKPEIFVSTLIYLGNSEIVSLIHVQFE